MPLAIHRTTLEEVNSPRHLLTPAGDWLIAETQAGVNFSAVTVATVRQPKKYWVTPIVGALPLLKNQGEQDAADLAELPQLKLDKLAEIQGRTNELIAEGFSYGGETMSLSVDNRVNAVILFVRAQHSGGSVSYPVDVGSLDHTASVSLTDANDADDFFAAAEATLRGHIESGRALMQATNDATTIAAFELVVDIR